jgi:hypothetical protein
VGLGRDAALSSPEQIAEWKAAAVGKTFTVVNFCKGDKCDPCKPQFIYYALIPATVRLFGSHFETVHGTFGSPPAGHSYSPSGAPGWPIYYGDGTEITSIDNAFFNAEGQSGQVDWLGSPLGNQSFTPDVPGTPLTGSTPGTWTLAWSWTANMDTEPGGKLFLDGDTIKALQQGHVHPLVYATNVTSGEWTITGAFTDNGVFAIPAPH